MNVIRQPRRGGGNSSGTSRPFAMNAPKSKGRGRGALDFDLIQYRPGQRGESSTSSSGDGGTRTPSNLQLQMAISSSAHRTPSSSTSNNLSSSATYTSGHPQQGKQTVARVSSGSSSNVTPMFGTMGPPKTPRNYPFTPKNSLIVSSTPRTTPTSTSTSSDQHYSHVVLEGRGHARGEVGIAVIDVKRPRLILCQLSDRQTYANTLTKISVFHPTEILIPHTFIDSNQPNKLYNLLEEKFPHVSMSKVQRRLFRDSEGLEKVQYLCLPENSSCQLILQDRFYALAAAAALLKYVEFVLNVIFAAHSLKIEYQGAHFGTIIDLKTAKNLELLLNQQSNNASHTLVSMMDHCCTHGGSRLLRASLLHPPCSLPSITRRQDGVQELVGNPDTSQKIREVLKQLPDVEQLLTLCMQTPSTIDSTQAMETRVNYVLMLKATLDSLPLLAAALEKAQSPILCKARECLQDGRSELMKSRILQTINEDVKSAKGGKTATFQRCFAVKSGVNDLMDVARKTYCELISDMHDFVLDLASTHSLPLKMNYSVTRGYHIQITIQKNHPVKKSDLPPLFVQVQQSRNSLTCTTEFLIHANDRINQVTADILTMSNTLLTVILNDIRQHISYLYEMCESIAEVDLILALAQISSSHNYVRPQFGDVLCLKASRHPILESITTCDPIANDIEASGWQNLSIITGPNMSGKSIYIRQVLLLQIMAQVGSYVPADQATFRITDRIFSHLNFDDSIENNASTLSLEMQEMQLILSSITATSLVALDELCRGTSVEEGTAIAWALCEELSQSTAFIFVTTHFRELNRLASLYPSIKNIYLETVEQEFSDKKSRLIYTHRLLPGFNPVEDYGLRLAENLDVPDPVLQMAKNFATQIKTTSETNLTSVQGDEHYTLAIGLIKLKALVQREDFCAENLLSAQLKLKHALEVAKERSLILSHSQLSPPVIHNTSTNATNNQRKSVSESPKLCNYSSSDQTSPSSIAGVIPKQGILHGLQKPVLDKISGGYRSPLHGNTPFSRTHFSSCEDLNAQRLSPLRSSSNSDEITTPTTTSITSENFSDRGGNSAGSPLKPASCCSNDTWLAESPVGHQIQNKRNPARDGPGEDSDSSDQEWEDCSVADETCNLSISMPDNMSVIEEETLDGQEFSSFHLDSTRRSLNTSLQRKENDTADFFQINAGQSSTKSNSFQFMYKEPPPKKPNFEILFKNSYDGEYLPKTDHGRKRPMDFDSEECSPVLGKSNSAQCSPSVSKPHDNTRFSSVSRSSTEFGNAHSSPISRRSNECDSAQSSPISRRSNQYDNDWSSPVLGSKTNVGQISYKKRSLDAIPDDMKKEVQVSVLAAPVENIITKSIPLTSSQAPGSDKQIKIKSSSLQNIMDSYCYSDSESD